jgi:hypothetical protein
LQELFANALLGDILTFLGIECVEFGASDLKLAKKFFSDWGLLELGDSNSLMLAVKLGSIKSSLSKSVGDESLELKNFSLFISSIDEDQYSVSW